MEGGKRERGIHSYLQTKRRESWRKRERGEKERERERAGERKKERKRERKARVNVQHACIRAHSTPMHQHTLSPGRQRDRKSVFRPQRECRRKHPPRQSKSIHPPVTPHRAFLVLALSTLHLPFPRCQTSLPGPPSPLHLHSLGDE